MTHLYKHLEEEKWRGGKKKVNSFCSDCKPQPPSWVRIHSAWLLGKAGVTPKVKPFYPIFLGSHPSETKHLGQTEQQERTRSWASLAPVPDGEDLGRQALHKQLLHCAEPRKISMAGLGLVIPRQTTVLLFAGPKAHTRHTPTSQLRKHVACTNTHTPAG